MALFKEYVCRQSRCRPRASSLSKGEEEEDEGSFAAAAPDGRVPWSSIGKEC